MSKNITVKEGGTGKQMTVNKLKTDLVGGGLCLWVPEDETQLTTKHITENGTYKAEDDDKYGYSRVTVSIPGGNGSADSNGLPSGIVPPGDIGSGIIGIGEDGNEEFVGVDEDENIVITPIPSAIDIIIPPTKTLYVDGETIDYTGIVVKLLNKNGNTFTDIKYPNGYIPNAEIIFPITTANASGFQDEIIITDPTYDGNTINGVIASRRVSSGTEFKQGDYYFYTKNDILVTFYGDACIFASTSSFQVWVKDTSPNLNTITHNNDTAYYAIFNYRGWQLFLRDSFGFPVSNITVSDDNIRIIAWLMLYEEGSGNIGGKQHIPVQWRSVYDSRIFEDTFSITVTGGTNNNDEFSGGESGF